MPKNRTDKNQVLPAPVSCSDFTPGGNADRLTAFLPCPSASRSALSVVALSPSLNQAANTSGIGKTTLRRWMNEPAFRQEVIRTRQEAAELARHEIRGMALRAVSVISQAMDDPDPVIRLRAARYALSYGGGNPEFQMLAAQLGELKESLTLGSPSKCSTVHCSGIRWLKTAQNGPNWPELARIGPESSFPT